MTRLLPALAAAAIFLPSGFAQEPAAGELPVFRTETSLALVRFHVVQKKQYVVNLKPEDIDVLEDGKPQKIALFEGGLAKNRTIPVDLILVFDTSGSVTQWGLLDAMAFKTTLLDAIPGASLSVYRFETRMRRLARATRDVEEIRRAFAALDKRNPEGTVLKLEQHANAKDRKRGIGGSPIFEAVMGAASDAATGPSNTTRMLLIFSDGFATSDTKPEAAAKMANDLGIPVYPVALGHYRIAERMKELIQRHAGSNRPQEPTNEMRRLEAQQNEIARFAELGEMTGGRSFDPRELTMDTLRQILQFMVGQVRNEYVAGYYPAPSDGQKKSHRVAVRLRSKDAGKLLGGTRTLVR